MALHDLLAGRQTKTAALVSRNAVETFEWFENLPIVFLRNADAVVLDRDLPDIFRILAGSDMNCRCRSLAEFDAVADQVLQKLRKLGRIADDDRQRAVCHARTAILN